MSRAPKQQKALLPSLDTGPVPLYGIRDAARRQLIDLIDSKRGKKALILEPSISGPLTLLDAGLSELLTEHGVVKLLYLERKRLDDAAYNQGDPRLVDVKTIIYVVRATLENAQLIAWQIKNSKGLQGTEFAAFWVPRRAVAVERLLEEEGVYGDLTMGDFALDMVPLDDDVLSLELDTAFRECTLEGDSTALFYAAAAIMRLQHMWGLVPRIQGKGPAAAAVKDMCIKMRKERPLPLQATGSSKVDRIILLDREVDVVTPMVTQITFEGLIDEITGIKYGAVTWTPRERRPGDAGSSADAAGAGARPGGRGGTSLLNSSDPFYREFRDLPWHITSQRLQQYARDARKEYTELSQKDLTQLKSFVKGLPKLMMLDRLSDIASPVAEQVKNQSFHDRLKVEQDIIDGYDTDEAANFIMELMWRGGELMSVLRLMVLLSTCCSGIPKKHYDTMRSELLATYGHQHLLTLINLEKAGLLRQAGGRASFAPMRKALRLLVPEDDALSADPTDVSFIYKGYAPISIRLVEQALKGGWAPVVEALSLLPGAQFDSMQLQELDGKVVDKPYKAPAGGSVHGPSGAPAFAAASSAQQQQQAGSSSSEPETVLVVFLGGCTFSEISALRWLGSRPDSRSRFIILTTKIINGTNLLDSFVDPVARRGFAAGAAATQAASVH